MNENMKRYLEAVGFKKRPEHREISQSHFNELSKKPEFRSMLEAWRNGQIDIEIVPDKVSESIDEYVVLDEHGDTEPEVLAVPQTKPISAVVPKLEPKTNVPLTDIPEFRGVGGLPPIVKGQKQRKGKTTIQIDDDIAEMMKSKKGSKSYNVFLRELLE